MEDYLLNTRDQYYMEGGMRVYNLKEVLVTGSRKKPGSESIYTGGINTYTIEGINWRIMVHRQPSMQSADFRESV
ncbi:hypothetical protein BFINE_24850 [Bacteroides finegoldii DSM 17565]|nr:hypothetical protein BFINE_24850 [Bacteroides finegoldii DSM 17565]